MGGSCRYEFLAQPNVEFEKNDHLESLNIEYLAQPIFESWDLLDEILTHTQKAKNDEIISSERIWMGVYYDKEIQQNSIRVCACGGSMKRSDSVFSPRKEFYPVRLSENIPV